MATAEAAVAAAVEARALAVVLPIHERPVVGLRRGLAEAAVRDVGAVGASRLEHVIIKVRAIVNRRLAAGWDRSQEVWWGEFVVKDVWDSCGWQVKLNLARGVVWRRVAWFDAGTDPLAVAWDRFVDWAEVQIRVAVLFADTLLAERGGPLPPSRR